jgi:uncharacterized membrane protein
LAWPGSEGPRPRSLVGWARPASWLLALLLVAIRSLLWLFVVSRFLRADRASR